MHPEGRKRRRGDTDLVFQYHRPLAYLRWAVLALDIGVGSAYANLRLYLGECILLVLWTAFRTLEPVRLRRSASVNAFWIVIDIAVPVIAVLMSGSWTSPFLLSLIPPLIAAGLTQRRLLSSGLGLVPGVIITIGMSMSPAVTADVLEQGVRWTGILMIVSLATGLAYGMVTDASNHQVKATDQLVRLSEANALLYDLQRIARRLPSSLDLTEVLRATTNEFAALTKMSSVSVLLLEADTDRWTVAEVLGASMPLMMVSTDLPNGARAAVATRSIVVVQQSVPMMTAGPVTKAVFAPLVARGQLIGLMVAEDPTDRIALADSPDHKYLKAAAEEYCDRAAVTLDNARWFGRIRSAAADDERVRIARDLHDRVGQSLALIGFEIDRITRIEGASEVLDDLKMLRGQVRSAVTEVRETLYDLRTDVRVDGTMASTLEDFLGRVADRSNLQAHLETFEPKALPVRLAREIWHIAQEAIINVERHAGANDLWVSWECDGDVALLSIRDNGCGFSTQAGRTDSYGLRGLRERAAAIGAVIDVSSETGIGTTITVRLRETS